jgi:hypothetical protein
MIKQTHYNGKKAFLKGAIGLHFFVSDGNRAHVATHPFCNTSFSIPSSEGSYHENISKAVLTASDLFITEMQLDSRELYWRPIKNSARSGIYSSDDVLIVWVYLYVSKVEYDRIKASSDRFDNSYFSKSQQEEFDNVLANIERDILTTKCLQPLCKFFSS